MAKRVFFSFHYQDVIDFRANVVRNHKITKDNNAGYFDASIWETAKKTSTLALKRLINKELENTSVTVILIGSETFERPWVRYEIFRSIYAGNKVIGVHINKINGKDQKTKNYGNNPFEYVGLRFNANGTKVQPIEFKKVQWGDYLEYDEYNLKSPADKKYWGTSIKLSEWCTTHCWIKDDGFNNFESWIK
jgi:hypothetical protein